LNFSCYIHSFRVHIHAVFTCVHALMHWHDSQRYTTISYSSPKSCALTVTVVTVQRMMWGLETVLHKNLHILAYLLYCQLNYLSVSLHWYWKILSICISSRCSCWRLKCSGMWHSVAGQAVCYILKDCSIFIFGSSHARNLMGKQLFRISGTSHTMTQCHVPEDLTISRHCCENFTSCVVNWSLSQISVEINCVSVACVLLCMIRLVPWSLLRSEWKAGSY
jgi:hypothetical protein